MATTTTPEQRIAAPRSGARAYDAFVSYSHAADGRLAPALQRGLQSLAKPWYRAGPAVFRDQTSLSASPSSGRRSRGHRRRAIRARWPRPRRRAPTGWMRRFAGGARTGQRTFLIALTDGDFGWDDAVETSRDGAPSRPAFGAGFRASHCGSTCAGRARSRTSPAEPALPRRRRRAGRPHPRRPQGRADRRGHQPAPAYPATRAGRRDAARRCSWCSPRRRDRRPRTAREGQGARNGSRSSRSHREGWASAWLNDRRYSAGLAAEAERIDPTPEAEALIDEGGCTSR